jgi:hypothetical protein
MAAAGGGLVAGGPTAEGSAEFNATLDVPAFMRRQG